MLLSKTLCSQRKTNVEKRWPYVEYYIGDKDVEYRKNGEGETHWTGAKSLECYSGQMVRDTMHGEGIYRWRYYGPEGAFVTYEGHFFNNHMHGYGSMCYGDGRVFNGIFHGNIRWGPGIESYACVKEDVGLWSGTKLIRLCWRPEAPSITADFTSSAVGREVVRPHRVILSRSVKTIGEFNSALELLKRSGANPLTAVGKWSKLYPIHCTDLSSALCHTDIFEHEYYNNKIFTLEESIKIKTSENAEVNASEAQESSYLYAWNNNDEIKHMMKHCYKHEIQRGKSGLDIAAILSGPRNHFKPAGQHEIDSRTLLMASYLGHVSHVSQLINENNVHPDVADIQGNTALMYATCGERADIIHFLVEAGANTNSCNDSCCTPLGMALIKLACTRHDIPLNGMLQAILPTYSGSTPEAAEQHVSEWIILRESHLAPVGGSPNRSPSKINKNLSSKKIKSLVSLKDQAGGKRKTELTPPKAPERTSDESFSEEKTLYSIINHEYCLRVDNANQSSVTSPYIFEVTDMSKEVEANDEDHKKLPDKTTKKVISKLLREATKPSKDAMWQGEKDESRSVDSIEKQKRYMLTRIMATIFQLLADGADPRLVKCPQPALFMAIASGSSEAVRHLICYGADINEIYPALLGYTPLDISICQPFTYDSLEITRVILDYGADTQHRLPYNTTDGMATESFGPTLLHAVLARRTETEVEEEIRRQMLELLLANNCSPTAQFKGRSAIDIAMTKSSDIFDIFVRNSKTNLNSIINEYNQTVLVKMFYLPFFKVYVGMDRLQTITDLLLYGSNPLIECQNGEEKYENLFMFAKRTLNDLEGTQTKPNAPTGTVGKQDAKNKKVEKPKKEDKISTKSMGKMTDDIGEYKQALELVTECARLLHIRWLQAKLVKELIIVIKKYSHRHWNMILKELKFKKKIGLWVTPDRCLEIWNILKTPKKKSHGDNYVLKHLLNIVYYCMNRSTSNIPFGKPITVVEKENVETNVNCLLRDYKDSNLLNAEMTWNRYYVKPELVKNAKIFDVCFECALPLRENKIICNSCKFVSFCNIECIKWNIERVNCHPCSKVLKEKYFPSNNESTVQYD